MTAAEKMNTSVDTTTRPRRPGRLPTGYRELLPDPVNGAAMECGDGNEDLLREAAVGCKMDVEMEM